MFFLLNITNFLRKNNNYYIINLGENMKKNNNKGFTLIELITTVVILSLIIGVTGYSISKVLVSTKEKETELLKQNIESAAETYYQECTYMSTSDIKCETEKIELLQEKEVLSVTLLNLVNYGFLTSNDTQKNSDSTSLENNDSTKIIHPETNDDISNCKIAIDYNSNEVKVFFTNGCPENWVKKTNDR